MAAIAQACADGRIDGQVVAVLGNYADSPALARARELGIQAAAVPSRKDEAVYGSDLLGTLSEARPDLICLAGYMRKVPEAVLTAYAGRLMNIHAALLPSFGGQGMFGQHIHEAVLAYGAKVSGCTVHFVDGGYDTGPIILQTSVPVEENDTAEMLAARVLVAEHRTYPEAVALFAEGRLRVEGRRVRIQSRP
jgi:phosphoribosylglycinamide formyltransferase-1